MNQEVNVPEQLPFYVANHYDDCSYSVFGGQYVQCPDRTDDQNYGINSAYANKDEQLLNKISSEECSNVIYKKERQKTASKKYREKKVAEQNKKNEILDDLRQINSKLKETLRQVQNTMHRTQEIIDWYNSPPIKIQKECTFINIPLQNQYELMDYVDSLSIK